MPKRTLKILLIDDQRTDREICKCCLQQTPAWKFVFAEAESASAGLKKYRTWRPDCILLDRNLPDMDGVEALARLGIAPGGFRCAVVMLTSYGDEELAVKAMKAGAMDYLPKAAITANDTLARTVINAIERFELRQRIETQRSALESSARRYQVLLESIPQMVWTADASGQVLYANHRWLEYTGLSLNEAGCLGWERLLHPDDRDQTWDAWGRAVVSGSIFEIEHRLKRAGDGSYRWHLVRAVPLQMGPRESTHWFGTCTDIEDQKQAERAIVQKQKLESLGLLAGGVAHDFNNFLMVVLGGASLAMESLPGTHPTQRMLRDVIRASEQAARLTGRMLAYAGKGRFEVALTDIDLLVRETVEKMRDSIPEAIRLEFHSAGELPPVETDAGQARQVIEDLVTNAAEAIGEGSPGTISVCTQTADIEQEFTWQSEFGPVEVAAGRYVALEVRDTGCGMDEETRKRIFDPFFTTKFTGRGLGLAAVRGFVRSNGGDIQLASAPGQGSRFRVLLPAAEEKGSSRSAGC
jgi:PAS domain S-box-containing protein